MKIIIFFYALILLQFELFSQTVSINSNKMEESEWFPSELNIQPFTANFLEAKAGFSYMLSKNNIRLDIGTSSDLYRYVSDNKTLSIGADLFTYTRLRGTSEFHFPVEAIDYLFGINAGYKIDEKNKEYGIRIRFSHISAHFVDGHYDYEINGWRNGRTPRVYSREFIELFPYYKMGGFRVYAGLTYLFHVTPSNLGKGIYQAGFDYFILPLSNKIFTPFLAADFKFADIAGFDRNNIISAGIKFGKHEAKGFSILVSYFSGKSIHGEYFDLEEEYTTIGFNLDL